MKTRKIRETKDMELYGEHSNYFDDFAEMDELERLYGSECLENYIGVTHDKKEKESDPYSSY